MSAFKRYERYKPSGVEWLGEVPEHWEVKPIKRLGNIISGYAFPSSDFVSDGEIRVLKISNIQTGYLDWTDESYLPESSYIETFHVKNSDIVFALTRPIISTGIKAAIVSITDNKKVLLNQRNALFRPFELFFQKFIYYTLFDSRFKAAFEICIDTTGQQPNISPFSIGNILVAIPNKAEQTTIALFLDQKTAQIDALIAKKQQLLNKLAEQRTALISHAVTKGLNPNAPMKDSGVEWLGEVPEHWVVMAIKRATQVKRGASPRPIDDSKYFDEEGEYAWVRISDVTASDRYLYATTQRLSELGASLSVPLEPENMFLSIAGSVGKPIISKIKCCIHDGFVHFPDWIGSIDFLYYIFISGQPYLGLGKMGTQLNLNTDTVGSIKIALPCINEQTAIAQYLDQKTAQLDQMTAKVKTVINKLTEYRAALITQAVTGKIDVRGFAHVEEVA